MCVCMCVCIWIDRKISTEVSKLQLTHLIRDFFLSNTIRRRYVSHACPLSPSLLSQDNIPTFSACMLFAFPPCLFQLRQQWAPAGRFFKLFFTFFIWKCNKLENTLVWCEQQIYVYFICVSNWSFIYWASYWKTRPTVLDGPGNLCFTHLRT